LIEDDGSAETSHISIKVPTGEGYDGGTGETMAPKGISISIIRSEGWGREREVEKGEFSVGREFLSREDLEGSGGKNWK